MSLARTSCAWYHHITHDSFIWSLEPFRATHPFLCGQIEKEEETDRARWLQIKKLFTRRVAEIPENIRFGRCTQLGVWPVWPVGTGFNCLKVADDVEYATRGSQLMLRINTSDTCNWYLFGAHDL